MTDDPSDNDVVLGRGIAFPLRLDGGILGMNAYESQVRQSILLILRTERGERVMRPDFGGGLEGLPFEPMNAVTGALVKHRVSESLARYEPRIEVIDVTATIDPTADGVLLVDVRYRIRRTDAVANLVYPFYVERGGV